MRNLAKVVCLQEIRVPGPRQDGIQDIARGEHVPARQPALPPGLRQHHRLLRQRPEGDHQPGQHALQRVPRGRCQEGLPIGLQPVSGRGHVLYVRASGNQARERGLEQLRNGVLPECEEPEKELSKANRCEKDL